MTNREYLIAALTDQIDDGGVSEEAAIYYNIACPYYDGDPRCHCNKAEINRETCVVCKLEWLQSPAEV